MAGEGSTLGVITTRADVAGVPPESPDDVPFAAAAESLSLGLPT